MLTLYLRLSIFTYLATFSRVLAQLLPDSQALVLNELEHLYLDNTGPLGFISVITPCTSYTDSSTGGLVNNSLGRQAAAQWIRTGFRKAKCPYFVLYTMVCCVAQHASTQISKSGMVSVPIESPFFANSGF